VTVYRDESKGVQVIYFGDKQGEVARLPIRRREKEETRPGKRPRLRMTHLKRRMDHRALESDDRLRELFEARERENGDGTVVVELTENSTCKTCEL